MVNPLMPGGNKKVTLLKTNLQFLKKTYSWKLQVCLSMRYLFVTTSH